MNTKKLLSIATGLALFTSLAVAIPVFAADTNTANKGPNASLRGQIRSSGQSAMNRGLGTKLGVSGTVTAINGNIITVNGRQGFGSTTAQVSYTVNATNATIKKNNATSSVSSIAVNDKILVQGTVTGTNVTATTIIDGAFGRTGNRAPGDQGTDNKNVKPKVMGTSTPLFTGNGQPIIAGTVSAVNGTTLTITNASNVTYSVDASNAKVLKGSNTVSLSSIVVGDKTLVQGAVNGTSVIASTVIDQTNNSNGAPNQDKKQPRGFFGNIGQFFMHMFGY